MNYPADPLQIEVARDRHRAADFIRRRDEIRSRTDRNIKENHGILSKLAGAGDMDPSGDLIEPSRYTVTGWRTRREDEEGQRIAADSPASAGRAVEELLRGGSYQVVIDDSRSCV